MQQGKNKSTTNVPEHHNIIHDNQLSRHQVSTKLTDEQTASPKNEPMDKLMQLHIQIKKDKGKTKLQLKKQQNSNEINGRYELPGDT